MIAITNLNAGYDANPVLKDFSLSLHKGTIYALIGPSGCGKSTLLRILCGIHRRYDGTIKHNGTPWEKADVAIGYVPQHYGLLQWKTVEQNIFLPLKVGKRKNASSPVAEEVIETLGIAGLMKRFPKEISGGQKQRVALARAFIMQPDILLMDEPFSALDALTSQASQSLFLSLWQKWRTTTLFITHNMHEAIAVGQEILVMSKEAHAVTARLSNPCFGGKSHKDSLDEHELMNTITDHLYPTAGDAK